jgi:hypothetical protein
MGGDLVAGFAAGCAGGKKNRCPPTKSVARWSTKVERTSDVSVLERLIDLAVHRRTFPLMSALALALSLSPRATGIDLTGTPKALSATQADYESSL